MTAAVQFLDPVDEPPPTAHGGRASLTKQIHLAIRSVAPGKWLPVECGTKSRAQVTASKLRKAGFSVSVVVERIYVKSCVHHWIVAQNGRDATCKTCGVERNDLGQDPSPREYGRNYKGERA